MPGKYFRTAEKSSKTCKKKGPGGHLKLSALKKQAVFLGSPGTILSFPFPPPVFPSSLAHLLLFLHFSSDVHTHSFLSDNLGIFIQHALALYSLFSFSLFSVLNHQFGLVWFGLVWIGFVWS